MEKRKKETESREYRGEENKKLCNRRKKKNRNKFYFFINILY